MTVPTQPDPRRAAEPFSDWLATAEPAGDEFQDPSTFVDEDSLNELLSLAWSTFVDPEGYLLPLNTPGSAQPAVVAEIGIVGSSPSVITLCIDRDGARVVTERMLGTLVAVRLDEDDIVDAIGELANILGGNLKALLPEGSHLTLPAVAFGETPDAAAAFSPDAIGTVVGWGNHIVTAHIRSRASHAASGALRAAAGAGAAR